MRAGGVSVVICCHNSAQKLPQTLAHLAAQKVTELIPWEVIVIDNASTDGTAQAAQDAWPQDSVALRVIHESQLGLSYARWRGFREAKYEFVCFVDDDNWVSPEWVQTVFEVMSEHEEVGACGGFIEEVCEGDPPWWFERYKNCYAPGAQGQEEGGDVTWRRFLMGAGLTIRKRAWQHLVDAGFNFLLVGRQGARLTAGEDHELCFALCLAGWRLWYEPRLRLRHFLPADRLKWSLLRRQSRGAGRCEPGLDPYQLIFLEQQPPNSNFKNALERMSVSWHWQTLVAVRYLIRRPFRLFLSFYYPFEGDQHILWVERQLGRFLGLLDRRQSYASSIEEIRQATWRGTQPVDRQSTRAEFSHRNKETAFEEIPAEDHP